MSEQDVLRTAREAIEAFSQNDRERFRATMTADAVYDEKATGRRVEGVDQVVELSWGWRQAFPDVRGTVTGGLGSGDTAVIEITWEGTQTGPLAMPGGELPASGKRFRVQGVQVVQGSGGKLREVRHYFDLLTMLQQIGAMPAPPPA
jgi:steroid delta-isomerase-like uncharacterized protein